MKLIIDIDEDYYNIIQKNGGSNYVEDAVLNGIALDNITNGEIINTLFIVVMLLFISQKIVADH